MAKQKEISVTKQIQTEREKGCVFDRFEHFMRRRGRPVFKMRVIARHTR